MMDKGLATLYLEVGSRVLGDIIGEDKRMSTNLGVIELRIRQGFPYHLVGKIVTPHDAPWMVYKVDEIDKAGKVVLGSIKGNKKKMRKARIKAEILPGGMVRYNG